MSEIRNNIQENECCGECKFMSQKDYQKALHAELGKRLKDIDIFAGESRRVRMEQIASTNLIPGVDSDVLGRISSIELKALYKLTLSGEDKIAERFAAAVMSESGYRRGFMQAVAFVERAIGETSLEGKALCYALDRLVYEELDAWRHKKHNGKKEIPPIIAMN